MKAGGPEGGRRVVYTLGTSTRSMEEFTAILEARGIARVCDVRHFPGSRRYPHFSREAFSAAMLAAGIDYVWLGERLGGYRKGGYEAHMRTAAFARGMDELQRLACEKATAVVCAEALPWRCHRRFIARALEEKGWEVVHVIDASRDWVPPGREAVQTSLEELDP
ncbi:MAG: DUF488 domain-containing protein [Actinomycetota bacterium]|nr:DUF488 domain-containing protein [Actinomycetota bacterium]MDD5666994.1 DUF488 domain-containing protein [Actinomycetota bacterium]